MPAGMSPDDPTLPQGTAQRFMPASSLHTIVMVEMPSLLEVVKALDDDPPAGQDPPVGGSQNDPSTSNAPHDSRNGPILPPPSITGRSLPLLFIRASDGVGYHSGRTIACENVFQTMDLGSLPPPSPNAGAGSLEPNWLTAAQNAAVADGGLHGWTLRVI
jgi:recombining binding protein suppressor of hairless